MSIFEKNEQYERIAKLQQKAILLNENIYKQYEENCRVKEKSLTIKCLLLQLGISEFNLVNVFVNGTLTKDLDTEIFQDQEIQLIGNIAGGC